LDRSALIMEMTIRADVGRVTSQNRLQPPSQPSLVLVIVPAAYLYMGRSNVFINHLVPLANVPRRATGPV
jgi:hypothetical protein